MTRTLAILAAATLVACSGDKDTGNTDTGADTDTNTNTCANTATAEFPAQGDADVYYRSSVRFSLDTEDPAAVITVADLGGTEVPGNTTVEGKIVTWRPTDALAPSTEYNATIAFDCGEASLTFTTSTTGSPTEVDLTGSVFALDVANGQWLQPPSLGAILSTQLGDTQIFVTPTTIDAGSVTMFGAIGAGNAQDLCSPTIEFPAADYTDPYFELQSPLLPLVVSGFTIEIVNLDLSGAFAPDGSRIQGASLAGSVDTRPLGAAFELDPNNPAAVCELAATLQVECEPCEDGEPYCLSVLVEDIEAPVVGGLTLEVRSEDDILADPNCQ